MMSPWIAGIAALFPGLGLLVLGKVRQALLAFGIFVVLLGYGLFGPLGFLSEIALTLGLAFWIGQIIYTVQVARRDNLVVNADPRRPKEVGPVPKPDKSLSRAEKLAFTARQNILPQLEPGESLKVAVHGTDMGGFWSFGYFSAKQFYMGVTQDYLVRLQLDWLGKPYQVFRDPLNAVEEVKFKPGVAQDRLQIKLRDQKKRTYQVVRWLREESRKLAELISK